MFALLVELHCHACLLEASGSARSSVRSNPLSHFANRDDIRQRYTSKTERLHLSIVVCVSPSIHRIGFIASRSHFLQLLYDWKVEG